MVTMKRFAEHLEPLGLNGRLWGALNVLAAEGAMTQHALGACVGIDPSSMVATIDELEAKGLVERRPHPSDRRAHALHLTRRGRQTLARGGEIARVAHEELLAPLNEEERKTLHELLLRLALATRIVGPGGGSGGSGGAGGSGAAGGAGGSGAAGASGGSGAAGASGPPGKRARSRLSSV
jgi:DNA-binding MarR family transcriptional regulator